jgi:hypothetical protein
VAYLWCNLLDMEAEGDLMFREMKAVVSSFIFFWKGGMCVACEFIFHRIYVFLLSIRRSAFVDLSSNPCWGYLGML